MLREKWFNLWSLEGAEMKKGSQNISNSSAPARARLMFLALTFPGFVQKLHKITAWQGECFRFWQFLAYHFEQKCSSGADVSERLLSLFLFAWGTGSLRRILDNWGRVWGTDMIVRPVLPRKENCLIAKNWLEAGGIITKWKRCKRILKWIAHFLGKPNQDWSGTAPEPEAK